MAKTKTDQTENLKKIGFQKGYIPWNKGKSPSKKTIEKHRKAMVGYKHNLETRKKISESKLGRKNWRYIDGRGKENLRTKYGFEWKNIRLKVYKRDKYTCQKCGVDNVKLDVHHVIPFRITKDNSLTNLISLCRKCHMKLDNNILKYNLQRAINICEDSTSNVVVM